MVEMDLSAMLAHQTGNDGEAQSSTHARWFRRKKRIEDPVSQRFRNSGATVGNFQQDAAGLAERSTKRNDSRALRLQQSVTRVCRQIHKNLLQLAFIA